MLGRGYAASGLSPSPPRVCLHQMSLNYLAVCKGLFMSQLVLASHGICTHRICELFIRDESGAALVEYAVLASLIAAVAAGIIATVGSQVFNLFNGLIGTF